VRRYLTEKTGSPHAIWRFNNKCRTFPAGKTLRLETQAPAIVHWSGDGWHTVQDSKTRDTGLGIHVTDLPTASLPVETVLLFTFYWPAEGRWEGTNFQVRVVAPPGSPGRLLTDEK
jgi:glucoamylase